MTVVLSCRLRAKQSHCAPVAGNSTQSSLKLGKGRRRTTGSPHDRVVTERLAVGCRVGAGRPLSCPRVIALEFMIWVYVVWGFGSCRTGSCCPIRRARVCRARRPFRVRYGRCSRSGGAAARGSPIRARCGCAADPVHGHVLYPMQRVPDRPTATHHVPEPLRGELGAHDVAAGPGRRSGPGPAHGDRLSDGPGRQCRPWSRSMS